MGDQRTFITDLCLITEGHAPSLLELCSMNDACGPFRKFGNTMYVTQFWIKETSMKLSLFWEQKTFTKVLDDSKFQETVFEAKNQFDVSSSVYCV